MFAARVLNSSAKPFTSTLCRRFDHLNVWNLNFSDRFVFNIFIDIVAVNIKSIQGE